MVHMSADIIENWYDTRKLAFNGVLPDSIDSNACGPDLVHALR